MAGAELSVNTILRNYLKEALEQDRLWRLHARPGAPLYGSNPECETPAEADQAFIGGELHDAREALAERDIGSVAGVVKDLVERHQVPEEQRYPLALGLLEAQVRHWQEALKRSRGAMGLWFPEDDTVADDEPRHAAQQPSSPVLLAKPLASALVEPFFAYRETIDRISQHDMNQERTTLRLFLDICGDRQISSYGRGDVTGFHTTLRRLPTHYGKSPKDKGRGAADIIAEADERGLARITDKTVKRHHTALSQFLRFAVDQGHITRATRNEMVEGHRFREETKARQQRDQWEPEELTGLFASPLWTGCHAHYRTQAGPHIIRDAQFWLPILAIHQGARLEELADLYRRDVWCDDGTWAVSIVETEDNGGSGSRDLKSEAAQRILPLHPELVRLGFIEYVLATALKPDDPLFPDLKPQGPDKKRGPRVTRWFVNYRKKLGLYREGVAMHAFRHTAITRLTDAINDFQQERHRDHMMGHAAAGGGEGRTRYDKGPGLKAAAATLALLQYPEVKLSHLYLPQYAATCGLTGSVAQMS